MAKNTGPVFNPKDPSQTFNSEPTIPEQEQKAGYFAYKDAQTGKWLVGVNTPAGGTTTGTTSATSPVSSMPVPENLVKQFGLPKNLALSFNPGGQKGAPYAPSTGKELYSAIRQAKSEGKITPIQEAQLISWAFGNGFTDTQKDATKVFTAATLNLQGANYSLSQYTAPSDALINSAAVLNYINTDLSTASAAALNAKTSYDSYLLNQKSYNLSVSTATAGQEASAYTTVMNYLDRWGLGDLSKYVWDMVTKSGDHMIKYEGILSAIRGEAPSNLGKAADEAMVKAYNQAFPGLTAYNNSKTNVHFTEDQYQTYVQGIQDSATQYGAPMPTKQEIGKLLNGNVSRAEYQQRVQDIYATVRNADAGTKQLLEKEFGINEKDLMHYVVTGMLPGSKTKEGLPQMQRQVASAEIQDYASRVGLSGVGRSGSGQLAEMARLASTQGNQALGYGVSQIENSLLNASRDVALTRSLPGQANPTVNTKTLIASQLAGYGGINQVAAQTEVARAEEAKVAPFEKGGGYVETAKGVTGLGTART